LNVRLKNKKIFFQKLKKKFFLRWIALPVTFLGIGALVLSGGHYTVIFLFFKIILVDFGRKDLFKL